MASFRWFRALCCRLQHAWLRPAAVSYRHERKRFKITGPSLIGVVAFTAENTGPNLNPSNKWKAPDPTTLTPTYLIKLAAQASLDSAMTLMNQTVSALLDVEDAYADSLERLIRLMELQVQVMGNESQEVKVWDAILEVKAHINEYKQKRQELLSMYHNADRILIASVEACFESGSDFVSSAGNELVHKAQIQVNRASRKSEELEQRLKTAEVIAITETQKKIQKEKKVDVSADLENSRTDGSNIKEKINGAGS